MTLTPLASRNFVKTIVKVSPETLYVSASNDCSNFGELDIDSAGTKGSVYDRQNFSKSILPTKIESDFRSTHNLHDDTKKRLKLGFSSKGSDLLQELDDVKNNDAISEISANNFKNEFVINRTVQNYLYGDPNKDKKIYLKDVLYPYYQEYKNNDNLSNINWGFSNYNSLNFFSQKFDSNSKNHSNCLVYPNFYNNNKYDYNFIKQSSFNISFFLNKRKSGSISSSTSKECILDIPKCFSIYLIEGTSTDTFNQVNKFKLQVRYYKTSNSSVSTIDSIESINVNDWHYVSFNFIKKESTKYKIVCHVDNNIVLNEDIENTDYTSNNFDNVIVIGNKFNHSNYNENNISGTGDSSFLRKRLFSTTGDFNVYENKFITNKNSTSITYTDIDLFDQTNLNLESLNAEISDFRIYNNSLDEDKIESNRLNGISNVSSEISNHNLCFFLPFYFVPVSIFKESIYNSSNETKKLTYTSPVNPYFSNFCGGHELNVENFVFEFVKKQTPNIIIGGANKENFYKDTSFTSVNNLIKYKDGSNNYDNDDIKKGVALSEIYIKNILNSSRRIDSDKVNNLIFRNNMILPNDNGIQKQNFEIISEIFKDYLGYESQYFLINDEYSKDYHVSMLKIISDLNFKSEYINFTNNYYLNNTGSSFPNISLDSIIKDNLSYKANNDTLLTISNILYHSNIDINTWSQSDISNLSEDSVDRYKKYLFNTGNSDPLNRLYKKQYVSRETLERIHTYNGFEYKSILLPYRDIISDSSYFHNIIIDISSQIYNNKIKKGSFKISDVDLHGTNSNIKITLKDNYNGCLYRSDCNTKVATWNYVGHLFYSEGIGTILHPGIANFGGNNFTTKFRSERKMFVSEINVPCESGQINKSYNTTYNKELRASDSAFDHDEKFVYITDINLHDENLNIVAKAKLAQPVPKKSSDNIVFRLKMDF